MSKSKGILLVAVNHAYYGRYAFQLALSLKHNNPTLNVAIAHDGVGISHLHPSQLKIFDKVIKINPSIMIVQGRKQTMRFKAYLYDITPYNETLFLDADILWNPKRTVTEFLESIPEDVNFTMQNRGRIDLESSDIELNTTFNIWVNTKDLKEAYGFKKGFLYNLSSELVFFRKCKEVAAFFKQVKIEFSNLKVNYENFAGGIPDELPFGIAMIKKDFYPHIENWKPIYWEAFEKKRALRSPRDLYMECWGVSFGGNIQDNTSIKFYNNLAQYYCNQFGEQHTFPLKSKRSFITERHTI